MLAKNFFTPAEVWSLIIRHKRDEAGSYFKDLKTRDEQLDLARQLLAQGVLHRCVYIERSFVDVSGNKHDSGWYGTDEFIPHFGVYDYPVKSLFNLDGIPIQVSSWVDALVDGFNATTYSVHQYLMLESFGGKGGKDVMPYNADCHEYLAGDNLDDENVAELLAKWMNLTGSQSIHGAFEATRKWSDEINKIGAIREKNEAFEDLFDLLGMALEGQFKGMPQGTPQTAQNPQTITGLINTKYDNFTVTDSYFVAKMISEFNKF